MSAISILGQENDVAPKLPPRPAKPTSLLTSNSALRDNGIQTQSKIPETTLAHIEFELPTYVARSNGSDVLSTTKENLRKSIPPPKPAKIPLPSMEKQGFHRATAAGNAPLKPTKPAFGSNGVSMLKNIPLQMQPALKPTVRTKTPTELKKPTSPKPAKPQKPSTIHSAQANEIITHRDSNNSESNLEITPKSNLNSHSILAKPQNKPIKPIKPTTSQAAQLQRAPTKPALERPTKSRPTQSPQAQTTQPSSLDFRATLSSVIRAQTLPQFGTPKAPEPIVRAQTVSSTSSSKPEKLTHPNKARSKGPKRRLPNQKAKAQVHEKTGAKKNSNSENPGLSPDIIESPTNGVTLTADPHHLHPVKERKVPPPKAKKPTFH